MHPPIPLSCIIEPEESSIVSVDSSAIVEGPQSRDLVSVDFEGVDELDEEGVPPSFVMPVQDVEVKPGETAHLRVKVAGRFSGLFCGNSMHHILLEWIVKVESLKMAYGHVISLRDVIP